MMASATVDFPQPDSPTRPSASPGRSAKLRPGTTLTSPARMTYEILTSRNSRIGSPAASVTEPELPEPDGQEVEPDDERGDRGAREERHVRPDRHHAVGVLHHAAPVRVGRGQPDAEEAEDADDHDVVAGAQAHVHDEGAARVRQDLDRKSVV